MAFSIQTNVNSLIAQENLRVNSNFQSQTIQRLTSGYRINSSADDAAGLAIANTFRSDTAELTQGVRNAHDGISSLQIIDGGMNNISKMLDRLRTLATQSASATFTGTRSTVDPEFQSLLTEIDRQAQSIGLTQGGQFAKSLSVFIGGGKTAGGDLSTANGTVNVDLSNSAVDTKSLGLSGMQAPAGSGDLSNTSATSVSNIVGDAANKASESTPGNTQFYFSGAGFSDGNKVGVAVNLSGVSDAQSLANAINQGIQNAGAGATPAATAFKNAGVVASVHTDASGAQQIAFTSSTAAFQVQAGDQMSNAIMGNFSTGATGASIDTSVIGQTMGSGAMASNVYVKISGGGMTSPVSLTLTAASSTVATMAADLQNQVSQNASLKAAGITVSQKNGQLVFTSAAKEQFSVEAAGDTSNKLGLGAWKAGDTTGTDYTATTGTAAAWTSALASCVAGGEASFEFSVGGAPAIGIGPISLSGGDAGKSNLTSGYITGPITVDSTSDKLEFKVDGNAVAVTLSDAGTAGSVTAGTGVFDSGDPNVVLAQTAGAATATGGIFAPAFTVSLTDVAGAETGTLNLKTNNVAASVTAGAATGGSGD